MDIKKAIELYKSVGIRNSEFLFNWLYDVYSKLYLPSIDSAFKEALRTDKTKLTIFDVLVDDLADHYKARDEVLLEQFIQIPWNYNKRYENEYVEVGRKIWKSCIESIREYPRFNEFKRIFYFDLRQVMSSMEYSFLVNETHLDNSFENKIYLPNGCMVVLHCDMDLMCSPDFDMKDLGNIREVFYLAQRISHLGNMLNTYPKEIKEKDYSSPIISLAKRKGFIKKDGEIKEDSLKKLESDFKNEIKLLSEELLSYSDKIKSVDINKVADKYSHVYGSFLKRNRYWELE